MAVIIYKDGGSATVEPKYLNNYLLNGWTVEPVEMTIKITPDPEEEKAALKEMGIEIVHPVSTPPEVTETKRRGRPKKNK